MKRGPPLPVHGLGKTDLQNDAAERLRQDIERGAARHGSDERVVIALGRGFHRERFWRYAMLAGEAGHGFRRGRFGWTQSAFLAVGLACRQAFGAQHQASRRRVQRDRIVGNLQLLELQPQAFESRRNHPIGNFFGADFEQEGKRSQAHCATSATAGCR